MSVFMFRQAKPRTVERANWHMDVPLSDRNMKTDIFRYPPEQIR